MYFGAHVSIAGGLVNAPLNAAKLGCEVFQFFSRSPQGGFVAPLNQEIAGMFKKNAELCAQREWYIHTPYFISLASGKNSLWHGSVAVLREELERGSLLGARYVITHMGSYKDLGREAGFEKLIDGLKKVFDGYTGSSELLIEISAGSGDVIGSSFEEIEKIIHHKKLKGLKLGVCYDTQHGFASGYDIRNPVSVADTFKQFDSLVGLEKLKLFHCNDSKIELGGHKDRHEHFGDGLIGKAGFTALLSHKSFANTNFIAETEHDKVEADLDLLKKIRSSL